MRRDVQHEARDVGVYGQYGATAIDEHDAVHRGGTLRAQPVEHAIHRVALVEHVVDHEHAMARDVRADRRFERRVGMQQVEIVGVALHLEVEARDVDAGTMGEHPRVQSFGQGSTSAQHAEQRDGCVVEQRQRAPRHRVDDGFERGGVVGAEAVARHAVTVAPIALMLPAHHNGLRTMDRLSDEQIERLQDLLQRNDPEDESLIGDIEMLDGFLCAVAVAAEPATRAEIDAQVWGAAPQWESPAEAQQAAALVDALQGDVARRIAWRGEQADDDVMPLVAMADEELDPDASDEPIGALWSLGFLRGRELRDAAWERMTKDIEGLADDLDDLDELLDLPGDGEDPPTTSRRLEILGQVPFLLSDLDQLRAEGYAPVPQEPVRRAQPKIGRNDPCHCGSGRKFKDCHGKAMDS